MALRTYEGSKSSFNKCKLYGHHMDMLEFDK